MGARSFPGGQFSCVELKVLVRFYARAKGQASADAWLDAMRLSAADIDDESKPLALPLLKTGATQFLEMFGEGAFLKAFAALTETNHLGRFMRGLREASRPEDLLSQLGVMDGDVSPTIRWETLAKDRGMWRGRITMLHDESLESDDVLTKLRAAELASVPLLFGFEQGKTEYTRIDEKVRELEVRWSVPDPMQSAGAFAVVGAVASAGVVAFRGLEGLFAVPLVVALLGGAGVVLARGKERKVTERAQEIRLRALERGLALRDKGDAPKTGMLDGMVIAGQFRLGRPMGSGASGAIYEATRMSDGLPVAVKLLRAATAHDNVASDRLRREAEALGLAWHPNVVEVLDHGHLPDGTSYLVLELLRGESVAEFLRRRKRITPEDLLPLALQLAGALVAIHAAGVVHRDVKPSNLFIVPDGNEAGGQRLKVLDFGIARVEWEEMRITGTGAPLGTPAYMAPEQEQGIDVDAKSDVFAAGAVMYEALVGEPPPKDPETRYRTLERIEGMRGDSGVHRAAASVPAAWKECIDAALMFDRTKRIDARELVLRLKTLEGAMASGEVSTTESSDPGDSTRGGL